MDTIEQISSFIDRLPLSESERQALHERLREEGGEAAVRAELESMLRETANGLEYAQALGEAEQEFNQELAAIGQEAKILSQAVAAAEDEEAIAEVRQQLSDS